MDRRPGGFYFYMVIVFSMIVFGYSIWVLANSAIAYQRGGNVESLYYGLIAASIGIVLAATSLMHMRRRLALVARINPQIITSALCEKCGFKLFRTFAVGDYVNKEAGKCQQCDDAMMITAIYAETPKKKSR